jgi:hypothetical protein
MKASDLDGKVIALLLMGKTDQGEDDWGVCAGKAHCDGDTVYVDLGPELPPFELQQEWLDRVRPVDDTVREMLLDAEYCLPLEVEALPGAEEGK